MFTGIITEIGTILAVRQIGGGVSISVKAPGTAPLLVPGASISLNGACQTVVQLDKSTFSVEAVEETLRKTTLGRFESGLRVNLEPPVRAGDPLGGHIVQGHVDGVGKVRKISQLATSTMVELSLPPELMTFVIPVGSIALDGTSLTVASHDETGVTVAIIPHTIKHTTLGEWKEGREVNVEVDLIGKYVQRLLSASFRGRLTYDQLRSWGYEL